MVCHGEGIPLLPQHESFCKCIFVRAHVLLMQCAFTLVGGIFVTVLNTSKQEMPVRPSLATATQSQFLCVARVLIIQKVYKKIIFI